MLDERTRLGIADYRCTHEAFPPEQGQTTPLSAKRPISLPSPTAVIPIAMLAIVRKSFSILPAARQSHVCVCGRAGAGW
jgi:hypothetical protein